MEKINRQFSRLDRRRFLRGVAGFSLGAASLGALAGCQARAARPASKRLPLIGYFSENTEESNRAHTSAMRESLEALGYREGQTIHVEWRYGDADQSRWPNITRELVNLQPDLIVVNTTQLVSSLLALTRTTPIVVVAPLGAVEDLIGAGVIKSQAHPGGRVTGLVGSSPTLWGKRLDLLHETLPAATRLAVLRDSAQPDPYTPYPAWTSDVISLGISGPEDLDGAFARFEAQHAELLAVASIRGSRMFAYLDQIAERARRRRLPATGDRETFARSGGLMSYQADQTASFRGVGRFVDKILKGANPGDLPVELAAVFSFVINKATADTLGLTIPPAVLAQATEVLQ